MSKHSPSIALLGCGYTLRRVADRLPPEDVLLIVHSEEKTDSLRPQFPYVAAVSIEDKAAVRSLFQRYQGIQILVDSVPPIFNSRQVDTEDVPSSLAGVNNIVEQTGLLPDLKRIVYLSTTGVFGVSDGSQVHESTQTRPQHPRSQARLESEELYASIPIEVVRLRVSAIYGPGRGIGTALKAGRFKIAADGSSWGNRIQVEDLATCIHKTISASEVPPVLCVSDGNPAQQKDVVTFYCETFGLPFPDSVSLEELETRGAYSRLSNQRIDNSALLSFMGNLQYPSYKEGARTEFE